MASVCVLRCPNTWTGTRGQVVVVVDEDRDHTVRCTLDSDLRLGGTGSVELGTTCTQAQTHWTRPLIVSLGPHYIQIVCNEHN